MERKFKQNAKNLNGDFTLMDIEITQKSTKKSL